MLERFKKTKRPVSLVDFHSQQEIDDFFTETANHYLEPLGFKAYAGRKWVAPGDGSFFKAIAFPLLAGHFNYGPVLGLSLTFVPDVKILLAKQKISLPTAPSAAQTWQIPYVPYWSANNIVSDLPKQGWTFPLRYSTQWPPKKQQIITALAATSKEATAYYSKIITLDTLEKHLRRLASERDGGYYIVSGFNETVASFQLAYALTLKKTGHQRESDKEFQLFIDFIKKNHKASPVSIKVITAYFKSLS